jgi:hypothetical protein
MTASPPEPTKFTFRPASNRADTSIEQEAASEQVAANPSEEVDNAEESVPALEVPVVEPEVPSVQQLPADEEVKDEEASPEPDDSWKEPFERLTAPELETFTRDIPGSAGHGVARAYGYIAVAKALNVEAELTQGGTRSTGASPLQVTVTAPLPLFERINDVYDIIAPEAESHAASVRAAARKEGRAFKGSYDVTRLTRASIAGFVQGAAATLREPGTTRPAPFKDATRARLVDEHAHRSSVASGRAWGVRHLRNQDAGRESVSP